ncbi:MAG TPA: DUF1330 domain-containing protein [Saprospiraceae bacterium]|nr:DUF1330 domain-containing protein [Saprospiraceae bacterium]MCB9271839.1 DUF1330 domain-containing protein [Lewinellaceae bacterium]HPG09795.1 DUF1330 domain-containing protein [Saprospiraceae bacterium]HRV85695.1 DUF1330 domain-containing protein [Saprospiraceae bacterium]
MDDAAQIYLTQLIYIKQGAEATFLQFEEIAMPLIPQHGGQLLLRLRPGIQTVIAANMEHPYEVHLVSFPDEAAFQQFLRDPVRKQFLHLKEASIRSTLLIKGHAVS